MKDHNPLPLTSSEWNEVATVREIRALWGLAEGETGEALQRFAYGAKFNVVSAGPGFVGELFVIADDALGGPPVPLVRDHTGALNPAIF